MLDPELLTNAASLGTAGLIALMWLSERKSSTERERQLTESHERIMEQRVQLDALMTLVRENTRAVTALEAGQQEIVRVLGGREDPERGKGAA
ncbi:MAG: hypothetical protein KDA20_09305 [Phycisphaerales bacterium]|nr:hypothetical protein [Phycisphaerales bacterium]